MKAGHSRRMTGTNPNGIPCAAVFMKRTVSPAWLPRLPYGRIYVCSSAFVPMCRAFAVRLVTIRFLPCAVPFAVVVQAVPLLARVVGREDLEVQFEAAEAVGLAEPGEVGFNGRFGFCFAVGWEAHRRHEVAVADGLFVDRLDERVARTHDALESRRGEHFAGVCGIAEGERPGW